MARPRVFVSSTYYDLKHVRASLDAFITSLGFEAVLFEQGDIAFVPDGPLDESCYREAKGADLFVLIIGGRYGSQASPAPDIDGKDFYTKYDSITKQEFRSAVDADIPVYILVESGVRAEFETFKQNRENASINYAHVDSANIFELLDEVFRMKANNPVQTFEKASDIENWLRDQWAGLFRDLLAKRTTQKQVETLSARIGEMKEINQTLQTYIEEVVRVVSPSDSESIIAQEHERLRDELIWAKLRATEPYRILVNDGNVERRHFRDMFTSAHSWQELRDLVLGAIDPRKDGLKSFIQNLFNKGHQAFANEINDIRDILGVPPFADTTIVHAGKVG